MRTLLPSRSTPHMGRHPTSWTLTLGTCGRDRLLGLSQQPRAYRGAIVASDAGAVEIAIDGSVEPRQGLEQHRPRVGPMARQYLGDQLIVVLGSQLPGKRLADALRRRLVVGRDVFMDDAPNGQEDHRDEAGAVTPTVAVHEHA